MPCNAFQARPQRERVAAPRYLSVWEVALLLSLDERTVRRMVNRGQLEHERTSEAKQGQIRLVARGEGERWIHPPGTFPVWVDTKEGREARQRKPAASAAPTQAP